MWVSHHHHHNPALSVPVKVHMRRRHTMPAIPLPQPAATDASLQHIAIVCCGGGRAGADASCLSGPHAWHRIWVLWGSSACHGPPHARDRRIRNIDMHGRVSTLGDQVHMHMWPSHHGRTSAKRRGACRHTHHASSSTLARPRYQVSTYRYLPPIACMKEEMQFKSAILGY